MKMGSIDQLPIAEIEVLPQVRQFSWGDIEELSRMIAAHGFCQPVIVEENPEGSLVPYKLIAGERRLRAVRDCLKWKAIPAHVVRVKDSRKLQLQENLGRSELHWLEVMQAVEVWVGEGATIAEVSETLGQHRQTTQATLRAYRCLAPENRAYLIKARLRPPIERALTWAAWVNKPDRQREEIEKWQGLQKSPKKPRESRRAKGPIPRYLVERMLQRAKSRKASAITVKVLRYLLGEGVADPFRDRTVPPAQTEIPPSPTRLARQRRRAVTAPQTPALRSAPPPALSPEESPSPEEWVVMEE